jgi:hypothetical protein
MRFAALVLFVICYSCTSTNEETSSLIGVVKNRTSCTGGPQPVFVIKLNEKDSIITATLQEEFQILNATIKFKTKDSSPYLIFCTTDKIYPNYFDVYDVRLFSD